MFDPDRERLVEQYERVKKEQDKQLLLEHRKAFSNACTVARRRLRRGRYCVLVEIGDIRGRMAHIRPFEERKDDFDPKDFQFVDERQEFKIGDMVIRCLEGLHLDYGGSVQRNPYLTNGILLPISKIRPDGWQPTTQDALTNSPIGHVRGVVQIIWTYLELEAGLDVSGDLGACLPTKSKPCPDTRTFLSLSDYLEGKGKERAAALP